MTGLGFFVSGFQLVSKYNPETQCLRGLASNLSLRFRVFLKFCRKPRGTYRGTTMNAGFPVSSVSTPKGGTAKWKQPPKGIGCHSYDPLENQIHSQWLRGFVTIRAIGDVRV